MSQTGPSRLRLAEPLAALSLMTDLARGQAAGQSLRTCVVAARLADLAGLKPAEASDVYYATLLRFVGCTATSHDYARHYGGDDIDVRRRGDLVDTAAPGEVLPFLLAMGRGRGVLNRARIVAGAFAAGPGAAREAAAADCEVAAHLARRFGLGEPVAAALSQHFERWDGRGAPQGLAGDRISPAARLAAAATAAVLFLDALGPEEVLAALRRWSGGVLDPEAAALLIRHRDDLLWPEGDDAYQAALAAEPAPFIAISDARLNSVLTGFAEAADLKSPYLQGHSTGVAALAEAAGRLLGLGDAEATRLRRAGWLHDIGRVMVPTGIWDKPAPLTTAEWELVRLHPYHTERICSASPRLRELAKLAGMHHERLNGYGYHRGAGAAEQDLAARVLAAADAYHAMTEERPHRPALSPDAAARQLDAQSLDAEAVAAVLAAEGQRPPPRREWPAGLTDREVEVLRPLVRGRSMAEIGRELHISPSTVHTHVAHIYEKAGVSTRAAAALFAIENGLLAR